MAISKSMLELHRVALELEKRSYGLDRPRRVTVQMAETPWTMDPRRHDRARVGLVRLATGGAGPSGTRQ